MKKTNNKSVDRLAFLLGMSFLFISILVIRLIYLQAIASDDLKKRAMEQWTRGVEVKSKRGIIYDRNGKKLAISVNAHTLWLNPEETRSKDKGKTAKYQAQMAKDLANALEDITEKEIMEMIKSDRKSVKVKQWLTKEEKEAVENLKLKGIQIADGSRRYYPNENFASYILGFTNIDNVGLNGIEKTYNDFLSGETGKKIRVRDGDGKQMPYDNEKTFEAEDGYNIVLTLDENIQGFAEDAADKVMEETNAKNISIIVMDPNNGDLLALANSPNYNPNMPRTPLDPKDQDEWANLPGEELQQKWYDMWRNYAISDAYEPGSTFKTIMAAAAIEENVANPDTNFYCSGFIRDIPGTVLKCSRWYRPHYTINLKEGLAESCNVVFVDLGRKLGKEKTLKYIKAFGFGENTGIELLGEQSGIISSSPEAIRDVNLATISYGHGIAVTPIQLINAISAISNGGKLMTPRLVSHIVDSEGNVVMEKPPEVKRRVISESTSKTMMEMMEDVVSSGTGGNAYVPGYRVAGKTGTAKKVVGTGYGDGKYIGSFVAVAPADKPQLAILVIVDEPEGMYYGGSIAAPAASEVIEKSLSYLEVAPEYTDKEKKEQKDRVVLPNLIGKTLAEAGEIIVKSGFKYSVDSDISSEKSKIVKQYPAAGERLEKGSIIDLYLDEDQDSGKVTVPNLINKSKDEVVKILDGLGLKYHLAGEGKASMQKPLPGAQVEANTNIEVEFTDKKD